MKAKIPMTLLLTGLPAAAAKTFLAVAASLILAVLVSTPASAQLSGANFKGDYGLTSASQPPPGWWLGLYYVAYDTDTVRDKNGDRISFDPSRRGSVTAQGIAPLAWWVSDKKILGANYSLQIAPAIANTKLAAPVFGLDQDTGFGLGDLYLQPINLGWHKERSDYTAGLGVYVPIGKYEDGADDNVGLGMWTYEVFAGATFYLNPAKTWNLALTAYWETHSEKEDSSQQVGDILTLEGGFGRSFAEGAINVGVAYYAQWKLTDDDFGVELPAGLDIGKHQVFGVGPEINLPIVAKQKLIAMLTARYLFESGAESTTEGDTFMLGLTFPVGVDLGS